MSEFQKDYLNDTKLVQNRTSFLIEDILYRQKNEQGQNLECSSREKAFQLPKVLDKRSPIEKNGYSYFQSNMVPTGVVQGFPHAENGYIQVMGALGAYLGPPYKNMTDPYFLTQGKSLSIFKNVNTSAINNLARHLENCNKFI